MYDIAVKEAMVQPPPQFYIISDCSRVLSFGPEKGPWVIGLLEIKGLKVIGLLLGILSGVGLDTYVGLKCFGQSCFLHNLLSFYIHSFHDLTQVIQSVGKNPQ